MSDTSRFVPAEGVEVHVSRRGAGRDVLLIHGASSDMGVFEPTIFPMLEKRFRVTAYDRPGMGDTVGRPPHAETLGVQAKVAADVIKALDLKRPIVVGHSYGGSVALRLGLDFPQLASGLVLIAAVAYQWDGGVSWHVTWSTNPLVGGLFNHVLTRPFVDAAARTGTMAAFAPSQLPADYFEKAGVLRATRPGAMQASAQDVAALKAEIIGQQARYPELKMPVALMTGDRDTVVSATIHSAQLAKVLPNARLDVLQGVGHLPHEASPERFETLLDWVAAQSR